jgi:hypothetical protein
MKFGTLLRAKRAAGPSDFTPYYLRCARSTAPAPRRAGA